MILLRKSSTIYFLVEIELLFGFNTISYIDINQNKQ